VNEDVGMENIGTLHNDTMKADFQRPLDERNGTTGYAESGPGYKQSAARQCDNDW
jgi:hypothetical protein